MFSFASILSSPLVFAAIASEKRVKPTPVGGLAQLGERLAGSQKVRGSSPLSSTQTKEPLINSDQRLFLVY